MNTKPGIEFGDQRAKDLIDLATEQPDPRRAIELLRRALQYGETGIQAGKAYGELGGRYADVGDSAQAIACYTRAIEVGIPNPYDLFWRGRLHYQLGDWEPARRDFKQALGMEHFWSPEREEAEAYLLEMHEQSASQGDDNDRE
jgi:tetratricopeptide (TPR) repeat protein